MCWVGCAWVCTRDGSWNGLGLYYDLEEREWKFGVGCSAAQMHVHLFEWCSTRLVHRLVGSVGVDDDGFTKDD